MLRFSYHTLENNNEYTGKRKYIRLHLIPTIILYLHKPHNQWTITFHVCFLGWIYHTHFIYRRMRKRETHMGLDK